MRNLKKILALVLALVMSLSLMATAGAAETTSATSDTNAYATAAKVLEGLKVLEGYPDGNMHYEDTLTRAHAAAVFYRVDTTDVGNKNVNLYTNAPFSDVAADHWGRGYIAYCYDNKIIKGMGDGTFGDKSPLTGYQVLVMALRELGYGQNNEFDGDNYQIKTASTATQIGMLKGVTPIDENRLGEPATRGLMSQIVFNMLLQDTVRYNALYQNYESEGKGTLGYQKFGLEEVTGVVVANEYADVRRDPVTLKGNGSPLNAEETILDVEGDEYLVTNQTTYLEDLGETFVAYTIETSTKRGSHELVGVGLEKAGTDVIKYNDGDEIASGSFTGKVGTLTEAQRYLNFGETGGIDKTKVKVSYRIDSLAAKVKALTELSAVTQFCNTYNLNAAVVYNAADKDNDALDIKLTSAGSGEYEITYTPKSIYDVYKTDSTKVPPITSYSTNGHTYSVRPVDANDLTKGYYFYVEIAAGEEYTTLDAKLIKSIFAKADRYATLANGGVVVIGEVYVGTQSVQDYSDFINGVAHSYEEFVSNYIDEAPAHDNTKIASNSRGWWLKAIDNDGDGYTDWVFQTRYTVAKVTKVDPDTGKLTLDTTDWLTAENTFVAGKDNKADAWEGHTDYVNYVGNSVSGVINYLNDDIAEGAVVYYAKIDGKCYAWKCDVVTGRVNAINRADKTVTIDGVADPYHESAVHEHSISTAIASGVTNMSGTVTMDLYLDGYGNVAAFSQNINGNFRLLTDGWAGVQKNSTEYAIKAWNSDTQAFEQFDVTEGGKLFVDDSLENYGVNSWNRIRAFDPLNNAGNIYTIMAYLEDDGTNAKLMPVDTVYDIERQNGREIRMIDMGTTIPGSGLHTGKTIYQTGSLAGRPYNTPASVGETRVRALAETVYLYVYQSYENTNQPKGLNVHQVVGYASGAGWLTAAQQLQYVEDVYVVGTRGEDVQGVFYTANFVVVELNNQFRESHKDSEQVFIYNFPATTTWNTIEEVDVIRGDGVSEKLLVDLRASRTYTEADDTVNTGNLNFQPGLYWLHRTEDTDTLGYWAIEHMHHHDIAEAAIYEVGTVYSSTFVQPSDYVHIREWYCNTSTATSLPRNNTHHTNETVLGSAHYYNYGVNPKVATNPSSSTRKVSTGKYYTLSWNSTRGAYDLTEGTPENVLRQYDSYGGTTYENLNQVLVRYNTSGVVYAVSFEHSGNAQGVWRSVLKDGASTATPTTTHTVSFYGVADGDPVADLAGGNAITLSYKKASAQLNNGENLYVVVTPGTGTGAVSGVSMNSSQTSTGTLSFTKDTNGVWTAKLPASIATTTGAVYYITVSYNSGASSQDWVLTVSPRSTQQMFANASVPTDYITSHANFTTGANGVLVDPSLTDTQFGVTMDEYVQTFTLTGNVDDVLWTFYTRNGTSSYGTAYTFSSNIRGTTILGLNSNGSAINPAVFSMTDIAAVQAVVISEDGTRAVYRTTSYGTFVATTTVTSGYAYPTSAKALADSDNDGTDGTAAPIIGDTVWLRGAGKGIFKMGGSEVTGGTYRYDTNGDTIYGPVVVTGPITFTAYEYVTLNIVNPTTGVDGNDTIIIAKFGDYSATVYRTSNVAYVGTILVKEGYKPTGTDVTAQAGSTSGGFTTWTVTVASTVTSGTTVNITIVGMPAADPAYAATYKRVGIDIVVTPKADGSGGTISITTHKKTFEDYANADVDTDGNLDNEDTIKFLQGQYGSPGDSGMTPSWESEQTTKKYSSTGHLDLQFIVFAGVQFTGPSGASGATINTQAANWRDGAALEYFRVAEQLDNGKWRVTPQDGTPKDYTVVFDDTASTTETWTVTRTVVDD